MASNNGTASARQVHTPLVDVKREQYGGKDMLHDPLATADPEVYGIMKNVTNETEWLA